ncbi:MAG: ABC transporter substrate-binding protein [Deltaproteobacteria bacterium]
MTGKTSVKLFALILVCGCLVVAGNAQAVIKIGMGGVLSGPFAAWGLDAKAGLEMAIDGINAKGGIKGEKVELLARDDALDTTKAALQAEELIYKEKVVAYFPSTITGSAKATVPVCIKAKVPAILGAQQSDITCPWQCVDAKKKNCCNPWVFRFAGTVSQQADAMVKMARDKLKGKRIALMHDNIGYGLEWKQDLTKAAKANNVEFVASEMFPLMELDYTAALSRVKDANADVIVVGTLGAPAGRIYNTMKKLEMKQPLLLCEAATELAFRTTAENQGDGAYVAMTQNTSSDTKDPKFAEFSKKWSKRFGKLGYNDTLTTQPHAFQYYDAMNYLAKVIEKFGKKPEQIRDGMEKLGKYKGISGITYIITDKKHCALSHLPVRMFRFKGGKMLPAE